MTDDQHRHEPETPEWNTVDEDPTEVAALRDALRQLDPLQRPAGAAVVRSRGRSGHGYRARFLVGAAAFLLIAVVGLRPSPGLPVIKIAGGAAGMETAADAKLATGANMSSLWMPELVLADGADLPAGSAAVYRLQPISEQLTTQLFSAFAPGAATEDIPSRDGGGRRTVWGDGTGPQLSVSANGSWWFSVNQPVPCVAVVAPPDTKNTSASDDSTSDDRTADDSISADPGTVGADAGCEQELPTLPSDQQATQITERLLKNIGLTAGAVAVEYRDAWSVTVRWIPRNPEVRLGEYNPLATRFGFGDRNTIVYAGGQFGDLEKMGSYPTISAAEALEGVSGGADPRVLRSDVATACLPGTLPVEQPPVATVPPNGGDIPTTNEESAPTKDGRPIPGAVDDGTEPTPDAMPPCGEEASHTVRIVETRRIHLLIWDLDGQGWLVPGYEYVAEDGGTWTATSLPEQYLRTSIPADVPITDDQDVDAPHGGTSGPSTVTGAPADRATQSTPASPSTPGTPATAGDSASWAGSDELRGLRTQEALKRAAAAGVSARVVREDGEDLATTRDFRPGRLNLVVEHGVVVEVHTE